MTMKRHTRLKEGTGQEICSEYFNFSKKKKNTNHLLSSSVKLYFLFQKLNENFPSRVMELIIK